MAKLQRKHIVLGLVTALPDLSPYLEVTLTDRKGWQRKLDKEPDLQGIDMSTFSCDILLN
jgi:hypothetical protein